jgi:hypothetical protein
MMVSTPRVLTAAMIATHLAGGGESIEKGLTEWRGDVSFFRSCTPYLGDMPGELPQGSQLVGTEHSMAFGSRGAFQTCARGALSLVGLTTTELCHLLPG